MDGRDSKSPAMTVSRYGRETGRVEAQSPRLSRLALPPAEVVSTV